MPDQKLPFTVHLEELRRRLIICFIAVTAGFLLCYAFKERIFNFVAIPLIASLPADNSWMVFTGVSEAFFTYLKISFMAGIFLSLPVIFYQLWAFIAPGLYAKERWLIGPIVILSTLLFVVGAAFGYFVVFPFGFQFFMSFATETIRPFPSLKEYLTFASRMLFAFGMIFELPLVVYILARMGILTPETLTKNRRYIIVIIFIVAAILTPPDVISQMLMAAPLLVLFEISVIVARVFGRKPAPDSDPDDSGPGTDGGDSDGKNRNEKKLRNPAA